MRHWFDSLPALMRAAIFAIAAAVIAACFSITVRIATTDIHPFQAVFFRFFFGFLLIAPMVLRSGFASLRTLKLPLLGLRAALSVAEMCFWFLALVWLPLATATSLNFTVPLFGTLLAALILKEKIRTHRWLAVVAGFIGVALVIRPGAPPLDPAWLLPIAAAMCMAMIGITMKMLVRTESATTIIFFLMLFTTPVSLIPALFVWQTPGWQPVLLMALAAAMMNAMQYCNVRAMQLADYSFFVGFSYLRLPVIALLAFILFGEIPDIWLLPGGFLIIGAALYVVHRERKSRTTAPKTTP
ncbi:MAG: DMT family transporter [Pseudomonadota bacterium]